MIVNKKYTAIQIQTKRVDDKLNIDLSYGEITHSIDHSYGYPDEIFDTEEEAIKYAYKFNEYANWLIVPIISF